MAGYHGRHGPNVSQYVAHLNTVPSPQDFVNEAPLNIEEDIALFTNSDFIDWDVNNFDLNTPLDFDLNPESNTTTRVHNATTPPANVRNNKNGDKPLDFNNGTSFSYLF